VTSGWPRTADAVVVGGGTIGAWCAWFLREAGLADVVLLEQRTLGAGASPRAAGMVRAQGGTEVAVQLGLFSRDFYAGQQERLGIDSGFVAQGYFMPCFSEREVAQTHIRIGMQQALGLDVRWVDPDELDDLNPAMARGRTRGGSYAPGDGYIDPPRNVLAYTGLLRHGDRVAGVTTTGG
jgi:sarcosine oxidase subunit beta